MKKTIEISIKDALEAIGCILQLKDRAMNPLVALSLAQVHRQVIPHLQDFDTIKNKFIAANATEKDPEGKPIIRENTEQMEKYIEEIGPLMDKTFSIEIDPVKREDLNYNNSFLEPGLLVGILFIID